MWHEQYRGHRVKDPERRDGACVTFGLIQGSDPVGRCASPNPGSFRVPDICHGLLARNGVSIGIFLTIRLVKRQPEPLATSL